MSYSALPTSVDDSLPQPHGARYPGLPWSTSTSSSSISSLAQSPTQAFANRLRTLATLRTLAFTAGVGLIVLLLTATQSGTGLSSPSSETARASWRLGSFASFYGEGWQPNQMRNEEPDNSKLLEPTWMKGDDGLEVSFSVAPFSPCGRTQCLSLRSTEPTPVARFARPQIMLKTMLTFDLTLLQYPPEVYPADLNPFQRANAALVVLVRNSEREQIMSSMRSLETKFNNKHGYPWVMMNEEPFTDEFKKDVKRMTRHEVIFREWRAPAAG